LRRELRAKEEVIVIDVPYLIPATDEVEQQDPNI
jgi:hypothetical protein